MRETYREKKARRRSQAMVRDLEGKLGGNAEAKTAIDAIQNATGFVVAKTVNGAKLFWDLKLTWMRYGATTAHYLTRRPAETEAAKHPGAFVDEVSL